MIRCFIFEKYIWGFEARLEQCRVVYMSPINSDIWMEIWMTMGLVIFGRKVKVLIGRNFGFEKGFFVYNFCIYILFAFPLFNNLLY